MQTETSSMNFGAYVFNETVLIQYLNKEVYTKITQAIISGSKIDRVLAEFTLCLNDKSIVKFDGDQLANRDFFYMHFAFVYGLRFLMISKHP